MEFLIITGLSGAGKSRAADVLEDLDFYCVDNLPAAMLPRFAEFCLGLAGRYKRVALVTDIRDREGLKEIPGELDKLRELGCTCRVLFVEAATPVIVQRYKETRRPHPLQAEAGSLEASVELERRELAQLRQRADFVVDTGRMSLGMLQGELYRLFADSGAPRQLSVNVLSFGFKYGIPIEADLVFDVRFLPNPYYVAELRGKTGLDAEVYDYVFGHEASQEFLTLLCRLLDFLVPQVIEEGKHSLTVAVGCTGGKHRSVAVARALCTHIASLGQAAENVNRDISRP